MKTVCRAAVAQWTKRLIRKMDKREFKSRKAHGTSDDLWFLNKLSLKYF